VIAVSNEIKSDAREDFVHSCVTSVYPVIACMTCLLLAFVIVITVIFAAVWFLV